MSKKFASCIAIVAIFLTTFSGAAAAIDEESYYPLALDEPGWIGITTDSVDDSGKPSALTAQKFYSYSSEPMGQKMVLCKSVSDPECASSELTGFQYTAQFSLCKLATEQDCIEKFGQVNSDGTFIAGTYIRDAKMGGTFDANPAIGLPAGRAPNIWTIGDQKFAISAGAEGNFGKNDTRVNTFGIYAMIQPITEVAGSFNAPNMRIVERTGSGQSRGWGSGDVQQGCQFSEDGNCALRKSFNLDNKYSITLRLSTPAKGWLHGRINGAEISMVSNADKSQVLTITGKPLQLPIVNGWVKWSAAPETIKSRYPAGYGGYARTSSDFTTTDLATRTIRVNSDISGQRAIDEMNAWLPVLSDKAFNMKTLWQFATIRSPMPPEVAACDKSGGVVGTVGTNASVYSDGPPSFDKTDGAMSYTVGAPHFDSKGSVFGGYYQLILRADVARCMYGFTNAPISAKVAVASSDGTPRVAVTTLNEKNGWLSLTATGFEFSTPKIAVQLKQEAVKPAVTPSPTQSAAPIAAPKTLTITCIKGKITKKVSGAKPICPTGYKKK